MEVDALSLQLGRKGAKWGVWAVKREKEWERFLLRNKGMYLDYLSLGRKNQSGESLIIIDMF